MKRLVTKRMLVVLPVLAAAFAVAGAAQASTIGQLEALGAAKSYLSSGHFSRAGLIHQLESPYGEDFSHADAVWGVNHAHANWNAEAVQAAKSYLQLGPLLPAAHRPARIPVRRALHARPGCVRREQGVPLGIPSGLSASPLRAVGRRGRFSPLGRLPCHSATALERLEPLRRRVTSRHHQKPSRVQDGSSTASSVDQIGRNTLACASVLSPDVILAGRRR